MNWRICFLLSLLAIFSVTSGFASDLITVSPDETIRAVRESLWPKLPWKKEEADIRFIRMPLPISLSNGDVEIKTILPENFQAVGRNVVTVAYFVDGVEKKKVNLELEVIAKTTIYLAANNLPSGHIISSQDLDAAKVDTCDVNNRVITNPAILIGKKLRNSVQAGSPFLISMVESPSVVKKGDVVTIVVEKGALKITAYGLALQDGCVGQIVKVKNMDSHQEIFARVIDSSTVEVDIGG